MLRNAEFGILKPAQVIFGHPSRKVLLFAPAKEGPNTFRCICSVLDEELRCDCGAN